MTRERIVAQLRELLQRWSRAPVDWAGIDESTAIGALGFDSLSILDLMYDVQQQFGVDFEAADLAGLRTVGDLLAFLEAHAAG